MDQIIKNVASDCVLTTDQNGRSLSHKDFNTNSFNDN
jgi:hypothetical protein